MVGGLSFLTHLCKWCLKLQSVHQSVQQLDVVSSTLMLCHSAWLTHPSAAVEVSHCPWWPLLNLAAKPGKIQHTHCVTPQPTFSINLSSPMYYKLCTHTGLILHSEPFKLLKALIFPLFCNNSLSGKVPTVSPPL